MFVLHRQRLLYVYVFMRVVVLLCCLQGGPICKRSNGQLCLCIPKVLILSQLPAAAFPVAVALSFIDPG